MSDLAKYLPLSQRERIDESAVTGNWSPHVARTLLSTVTVLETLAPAEWQVPARRAGFTVRDTVGHLLWRLRPPTVNRMMDLLSKRSGDRDLTASRESSAAPAEQLVLDFRALATAASAAQHSVADLTVAVADACDIARSLGAQIDVEPVASGAVAVACALAAPFPVRAVVRGRTIVATDAGWVVGRGPRLSGSAADIILFLVGRGPVPQGQN